MLMECLELLMKLGSSLFELLSEGLGLNPDHLNTGPIFYLMQPELTYGTSKHADNSFITLLLQYKIGGRQFVHVNQWVDVPPMPGALVVNIGHLSQASLMFISSLLFILVF
ncbi:hypothetical protein RJ640_010520 [Escallonia rubra]|uniref:Fe2OG dioxygenase domain-containing protein n=1 Tax=Escallonia rubra TaxID=112253 RepID=A0AA88QRI8_9ASTE|nr:hypothetical protein RJ640_010520 [Escallonia rubra]